MDTHNYIPIIMSSAAASSTANMLHDRADDPIDQANVLRDSLSRFSRLPNEILLMIIESLINIRALNRVPPVNAASLADHFRSLWLRISDPGLYRADGFSYKPTSCHWTICGSDINIFYRPVDRPPRVLTTLLSLDSRTRNKALEIIWRFLGPPRLDIIYIKASGFWLTWLSTLIQLKKIPELHVQVRAFEYPMRPSQFGALRRGDLWTARYGPGFIMVSMLMDGILQKTIGPWPIPPVSDDKPHGQHCYERRGTTPSITIKRLVMNFCAMGDATPIYDSPISSEKAEPLYGDPTAAVDIQDGNERAAFFMSQAFKGGLLSAASHVTSSDPFIRHSWRRLLESVGEVQIQAPKRPLETVDFQDLIVAMPNWGSGPQPWWPFSRRAHEFHQWQQRLIKKRSELGLGQDRDRRLTELKPRGILLRCGLRFWDLWDFMTRIWARLVAFRTRLLLWRR